jgi:hypothetical protein
MIHRWVQAQAPKLEKRQRWQWQWARSAQRSPQR